MVFQYIYYILKNGFFLYLLNDYLKRYYPNEYKQTIIVVSFNAIYLYSKCQITYVKTQRSLIEYIKNNPNLLTIMNYFYKEEKPNSNIEIIKNGEISEVKITSYINEEFLNNILQECDFIIYSDNSKLTYENKCVNKMIIFGDGKNEIINRIQNYEISTVQFMLLELTIGDNVYKIDLKNENYNYYIVNNIFNKKFFIYFLKNHFSNINLVNIDDVSFSLKIIDHNVSVVNLTINKEHENVKLAKNEYICNVD